MKNSKSAVNFANAVIEAHACIRPLYFKNVDGAKISKSDSSYDAFVGDKWFMRGEGYDSGVVYKLSFGSKPAFDRIVAYIDLIGINVKLSWKNGRAHVECEDGKSVQLNDYNWYNLEDIYLLGNGYRHEIYPA